MNEHVFLLFPNEGEAKEQFKEYFKKVENYLKSLGLKNIINPAKVEKALDKCFNNDLGTLNVAKFNKELKSLERIVTMYLDYAEDQAERHIPMTMEDWKGKLDVFLQFNERDVLDNPGKVSHKVAESFALSEFEKYRITQDKLFESDFDKFMIEMENKDINC